MSTVDTPAHEVVIAQAPEERQQCLDVPSSGFRFSTSSRNSLSKRRSMSTSSPYTPSLSRLTRRIECRNEDISTHFLLRLVPSLTPIGTIRAFKSPHGDYYKLTRLAVLKDYRKYRFGRLLVESLHGWVQNHASETNTTGAAFAKVVCHSQLPVQGFYTKFGYAPEGEQFDEDGDPHQKMVLRLPL
ncbi:hypothetical protein D9611_002516 [Ephemerocybe angulata]|uniref:N-acetyltransferase domain-containing protein n=1 Tax=Ephemerocybe angulata TaxID=980116 RepID=A0A8H5FDY3_9AGAR|nr:hypothetical protein D9611_002516 [Tulosesus angulatus]